MLRGADAITHSVATSVYHIFIFIFCHWGMESLAELKFLILMRSNLTIFSSMGHAFGVVSKNSSPSPKALSPMLSSRSL